MRILQLEGYFEGDFNDVYDELMAYESDKPSLGAGFITEDGTFINLGKNTMHGDIFGDVDEYESDDFYTLEDAFNLIKINGGCKYEPFPYIDLWYAPNSRQSHAILTWLDFLQSKGKRKVIVNMPNTYREYNFNEYISDDILKDALRSLNGLTEDLLDESAKTDFIDKFGEDSFNKFEKARQRMKNNGLSTDYQQYLKMSKDELISFIASLYDDKKDAQKKRIVQGGDKSLGELGLQESLEESFDRYIIIHNSPSGEEVYRTDDFQDACEELLHWGRAYKIIDTQDDYKEYKLSDASGALYKNKLEEVYPNKGESKKDFIARFMSVTKNEYPDVKQRYAVANSYWERRNKKSVNESTSQTIVAYHSSPNKFTKFDKKYINTATSDGGMYGKGFYFADKELAQQFNYSGYLYKVKLLFSKPYILNTDKDRETFEALINAHYDSKTKKNNSDLTDFFNAGYDGVISNNEIWKDELDNKKKIHSQFVVYDPSQITILSIEPYSLDDNYNLNEDINQEMSNEYDSEGNQLTKTQAEFFKNSKVRDKNDNLLVAYHGSQRSNLELSEEPIYLVNDKGLAREFAIGYAFNYDLQEEDEPTIYTIEVNFNNPYYIKSEDEYNEIMDIVNIGETKQLLTENNYDGIIYQDEYDSDLIYYMPLNAKKQCNIVDEEILESYIPRRDDAEVEAQQLSTYEAFMNLKGEDDE